MSNIQPNISSIYQSGACLAVLSVHIILLACLSSELLILRLILAALTLVLSVISILFSETIQQYKSLVTAGIATYIGAIGYLSLSAFRNETETTSNPSQSPTILSMQLRFFFGLIVGSMLSSQMERKHKITTILLVAVLWSFQDSESIKNKFLCISFSLELLIVLGIPTESRVFKLFDQFVTCAKRKKTINPLSTTDIKLNITADYLNNYDQERTSLFDLFTRFGQINMLVYSQDMRLLQITDHFLGILGAERGEQDVRREMESIKIGEDQNLWDHLNKTISQWYGDAQPGNSFEVLCLRDRIYSLLNCQIQLEKYQLYIAEIRYDSRPAIILLANTQHDLATFNQYKHKMINSISHDLKTPLNAIILLIDILKQQLAQNKNKQNILSSAIPTVTAGTTRQRITTETTNASEQMIAEPLGILLKRQNYTNVTPNEIFEEAMQSEESRCTQVQLQSNVLIKQSPSVSIPAPSPAFLPQGAPVSPSNNQTNQQTQQQQQHTPLLHLKQAHSDYYCAQAANNFDSFPGFNLNNMQENNQTFNCFQPLAVSHSRSSIYGEGSQTNLTPREHAKEKDLIGDEGTAEILPKKESQLAVISASLIPLQEEEEEDDEEFDGLSKLERVEEEWLRTSSMKAAQNNHKYHQQESLKTLQPKQLDSQGSSSPVALLKPSCLVHAASANNQKYSMYKTNTPLKSHAHNNATTAGTVTATASASTQPLKLLSSATSQKANYFTVFKKSSGDNLQDLEIDFQTNSRSGTPEHQDNQGTPASSDNSHTPISSSFIAQDHGIGINIPMIHSTNKQYNNTPPSNSETHHTTNTSATEKQIPRRKTIRFPMTMAPATPKSVIDKLRNKTTRLSQMSNIGDIKILYSYICSIEKNGALLESRINDLIDYSTLLSSNNLSLSCTEFDLGEVLYEMKDLFGFQAKKKNCKLLIPAPTLMVKNDKARIKQILNNIIGNAIKFTFEGFIRITISPQEHSSNILVVTVQDTGIGIPEAIKINLLNFNAHISQVKDDSRQGVGIGLEICSRLCQIVGPSDQELQIQSAVNEGSSFSFEVYINHPLYQDERELSSTHGTLRRNRRKKLTISNHINTVGINENNNNNNNNNLGGSQLTLKSEPEHEEDIHVPLFETKHKLLGIQSIRISNSPDSCGFATNKTNETKNKPNQVQFFSDELQQQLQQQQQYQHQQQQQEQKPQEPKKQQKVEEFESDDEKERILIVDDVAFNLLALRNTLRLICPNAGIIEAQNGKQAVELVREYNGRLDLIIMDINMPIMDGFQAMQLINTDITAKRLEFVPILAHTAFDNTQDKQKCYALGAQGFIPKPVKKNELQKAISPYLTVPNSL